MSFRILDEVDSLLWTVARHGFVLPEEERVAEVKPTCRAEYGRNIAQISKDMQGPYLMGDAITVPDILLGHCRGWGMMAKSPNCPKA